MKILIIGGSGKIGKLFNFKNSKTFHKNKVKNGIKFNLIKDNIVYQLKKYNINKVVILSAISDPDICLKNKKYSNIINVEKTIQLIDILINKNIYFIFFSSEYIFDGKIGNYSEKSKTVQIIFTENKKLIVENYIKKKLKTFL